MGDLYTDDTPWATVGSGARIEANGHDIYDTPYGNQYAALYGEGSLTPHIYQELCLRAGDYTLIYSYALSRADGFGNCTLAVTMATDDLDSIHFDASDPVSDFTTRSVPFPWGGRCSGLAWELDCNLQIGGISVLIDQVVVY